MSGHLWAIIAMVTLGVGSFVGANFGAYVTHEEGRAVYFYIGQQGFFLFMTR